MEKALVMVLAMAMMMAMMVEGEPTCSPAGRIYCNQGRCCSKYNWCGTGPAYCSKSNCIAQCSAGVSPLPQSQIILSIANLTAQPQAHVDNNP